MHDIDDDRARRHHRSPLEAERRALEAIHRAARRALEATTDPARPTAATTTAAQLRHTAPMAGDFVAAAAVDHIANAHVVGDHFSMTSSSTGSPSIVTSKQPGLATAFAFTLPASMTDRLLTFTGQATNRVAVER